MGAAARKGPTTDTVSGEYSYHETIRQRLALLFVVPFICQYGPVRTALADTRWGWLQSGLVSPQDTFSGLSRSAVITLIAIFILTHALFRTGVTKAIGLVLNIHMRRFS